MSSPLALKCCVLFTREYRIGPNFILIRAQRGQWVSHHLQPWWFIKRGYYWRGFYCARMLRWSGQNDSQIY